MNRRLVHALFLAVAVSIPRLAPADEPDKVGRQPPSIPNPYLLLIRDPVVHRELQLTRQEIAAIRNVTDEIDAPLLSTRNKSATDSHRILSELIEQTENRMSRALPSNKRARLEQIVLQARGIEAILLPDCAKKLDLSDEQYTRILGIVNETREKLLPLQKEVYKEGSTASLRSQIEDLRDGAKRDILKALTRGQRTRWSNILGTRVSTSQFGNGLVFKAPEIAPSDEWINSRPLTIAALRGRVVAVHFYAFG